MIILFIAPVMLFMIVMVFYPLVVLVRNSFTTWDGLNPATFNGIKNYVRLFKDPLFYTGLKNGIIYAAIQTCYQIPLATLLAFAVKSVSKGEKKFFRIAYYIPAVLSVTVVCQLWVAIYDADYGLINKIFEALGIKDFMTSDEYTAYVKKGANTNEKMDRRIRGIITPIFTLVDAVASAESPVDEVLKLLPNLASAIDTGLIDTQIHSMLGKISLGIGNSVKVDLTTGGVYDMIAPKLKDIELQAAKVDENGEETAPAVTLTINLDKEKFAAAIKDIAACGVFTAKESAAKTRNWFVGIEGDSADAFVVLFRYLHSELTEENNAVAIKTAVAALDMNASQKIVVNFLVSSVLSSSADGALRTIVALLPLAKTGVKIAARFGAFDK